VSRYIVYFHPGDPVPDRMKYVDDETTAPDVTDDAATLGVTIGSLWIDTAAPAVYVCADASTGAAVWIEVSGGGSIDWGEDADITMLDYDDVADSGALDEVARADHRHGMPAEGAGGATAGQILISDTPSTPLVFADLIQNEAEDDLVYSDT
jgi:hypothetical protein